MRQLFSEFLGDQSGATAIEYCLIACGIAFAIIAAVQGIGPQLNTKFSSINSSLKQRGRGGATQELLFGTWSPQIISFCRQYPWQVFAFVLVTALVVFDLTRKNRSASGGDLSGFDFGDGDGGGE
jgi:pilus assembly protein Flp/PilA